jgi:hypothetical protein
MLFDSFCGAGLEDSTNRTLKEEREGEASRDGTVPSVWTV